MTAPTHRAAVLEAAIRAELVNLWGDLSAATRAALRGGWSMQCDSLAERIIGLSRLVGATPWGDVDVHLLRSGVYERVHRDAGVDYPPADAAEVERVWRYIRNGMGAR